MRLLTTLAIQCVCLFWGVTQTFGDGKDRLVLTVLYESKCPDCQNFIVHQLYNTWREFKSHIKLDLAPFGKALKWYKDGLWHFSCQHGAEECVGNKQQACAINQACGGHESLECPADQLAKAMEYINCVMQPDQQTTSDQCASQAGLRSSLINKCANGNQGEKLMSFYGSKPAKWSHTPEFQSVGVPFIVINTNYSEEVNAEAQQDLRSVICKYIPDQCKEENNTRQV